jgi:hypothetical protein
LESTSIHTRVNNQFRISSIWREYSNPYFQQWAWETIVWKRTEDKESIDYQASNLTIEETLSLHKRLYEYILSGLPYEDNKDDE